MLTNADETTKERYQREHYGYLEMLENEIKALRQRNSELNDRLEIIAMSTQKEASKTRLA